MRRTVYLLDTTGRVVGWPLRRGGRPDSESFHRHISAFYTPDARAAGEPERDLLLAWEGGVELDGWRVREDGSRFWAGVTISPFEDQAGRALGFVLVLHDQEDGPQVNQLSGGMGRTLPAKFDRRKR